MEAVLEAVARDTFGKNEARRTRAAGKVPAVVYGASSAADERKAQAIAVDPKALLKILHTGANTLISLKLDGAESKVLVKEYQLDPACQDQSRNEQWVTNIQVAPLLGLTDLDLSQCKLPSSRYKDSPKN